MNIFVEEMMSKLDMEMKVLPKLDVDDTNFKESFKEKLGIVMLSYTDAMVDEKTSAKLAGNVPLFVTSLAFYFYLKLIYNLVDSL